MQGRAEADDFPALRSVDVVRVKTESGFAIALRDGEGMGETVLVHPPFDRLLPLFDGSRRVAEIAAVAKMRREAVEAFVAELHDAFLLKGARAEARRSALVAAFATSNVRPPSHAGGAYHREPKKLERFIDDECLGRPPRREPAKDGGVVGLVAPHMDLWRASKGYGAAYRALSLSPEAETFVLLGTCHAGMATPFSICRKDFATPLGTLGCATDLADHLARTSRFDVYADEYQHKAEHSIEFQAVFLRHLLGEERAARSRILPILCGLGRSIARRVSPRLDRDAERFVATLADLLAARTGRVVVIAGADLAHVGPRFGDPRPLNKAERGKLEARDRTSIACAMGVDHEGFFADTSVDVDTRRVCGIGPIYTAVRLAEALDARESALHHYTMHIAPDEGSIVSHASLTFQRAGA
jgi:AmmeMemoRadiSam system protein B